MAKQLFEAEASPEKRLFISLITRDIGLVDALIDLTDNSVNAAMKSNRNSFASTDDFEKFIKRKQQPSAVIDIKISVEKISISDNAGGISFAAARDDVFKFGHPAGDLHTRDRLSVYGIGMKRALFKLGNKVEMTSDHPEGGFYLDLDVAAWEKKNSTLPWHFEIEKRNARASGTGTTIEVTELYGEIKRRIADGRLIDSLKEKMSQVYSYFLGRLISIRVNGSAVEPTNFDIGNNNSRDSFEFDDVTYSIAAGIAQTPGNTFKYESAGWYVFCNGRNVVYADKTRLTGWNSALPIFQPKHRPFIGMVFFVSADPEALPWTTTKGSINEDSLLWQEAKKNMVIIGRAVLTFLDKVYSDSGTEIERSEIAKLSGKRTDAFAAATAAKAVFRPPQKKNDPKIRVQFDAKEADLERIRKYLSKPRMSGSDVGRYTFRHFLENEVGS